MTQNDDKAQDQLGRLADFLADDAQALSDTEVLIEADEDKIDADAAVESVRTIVAEAIAGSDQTLIAAAKIPNRHEAPDDHAEDRSTKPASIQRKLTTIFAAYVEDYGSLDLADEFRPPPPQRNLREVIEGLVGQHDGRIFATSGESILVEFASPLEAVRCAITIQDQLRIENAELAEESQITFRIGINVGDVMVDGDNLYGDGVTVAARLASVAEVGGICISGSTFDQVKDKLSIGFEDIGPQQVENITSPVPSFRVVPRPALVTALAGKPIRRKRWHIFAMAASVAAIVTAGGLAFWQPWITRVEAASLDNFAFPLPDKPSIAVIPFANLSGDPEQDYLSDGITENIATALRRNKDLFVIGQTTSRTYKGQQVQVHQIAEELGVRYVVEGSVRTPDDKIVVVAKLVDALAGRVLWEKHFEHELKDAFVFQDVIALNVLSELRVNPGSWEGARFVRLGTNNLEAYQLVRQAIPLFQRGGRANNHKARELFQKAAELDPNYALAWYFVGNAYLQSARFGHSSNPAQDFNRAKELAEKARAIDPSHPSPYTLLAQISMRERDYDAAISHMEQALELSPNHAFYLTLWGRVLTYAGQPEEGLPLIQQGIRRSPRAPSLMLRLEGETYHAMGRYEEAIAAFERARARDPKSAGPQIWLLMTYADMGRTEEARAAAKELLNRVPSFHIKRFVHALEYKDRSEVERRLASLRKLGLPELNFN
jgi:adenylate cyclase